MNLKRIITSGRYIPEIDGLRFVAILAVLLYHIPGNLARNVSGNEQLDPAAAIAGRATGPLAAVYSWLSPAYSVGVEGVLLFFGISGFILSLPFARQYLLNDKPVSLRKYFIRRLTRLEPPYIIAMTALLGAGCILGRFSLRDELPHLAASLAYVHNIIYDKGSTINNAAWSLEVEVQFYVLAPLLCWLAFRKPVVGCWLIPAAIVASACGVAAVPMETITLARFLQYFLAGVGAGGLYVARPNWFEQRSRWADVIFIVAMAVAGYFAHGDRLAREVLLPFCFATMLLCALKGCWVSRVLGFPLISRLGGMCYTTYLYHGRLLTLPMVYVLSRVPLTETRESDIMLATLLLVPLVFVASIPLFLMFEKPFMNPRWPIEWAQRYRSFAGGHPYVHAPSAANDSVEA